MNGGGWTSKKTAMLTTHTKANSDQCGHDLATGNPRQSAHTATINASNFSSGTGSPSSLSTCTYPSSLDIFVGLLIGHFVALCSMRLWDGCVPPTAEGFVDGDKAGSGASFALGELALDIELDAFGVENGKEVGKATVVALVGERNGFGRGAFGGAQVIAPGEFTTKIDQRVFGFFERGKDGFFVGGELGIGLGMGGLDTSAHVAKVEGGPGNTGSKGMGVGAG